jgi:hypothetical protein
MPADPFDKSATEALMEYFSDDPESWAEIEQNRRQTDDEYALQVALYQRLRFFARMYIEVLYRDDPEAAADALLAWFRQMLLGLLGELNDVDCDDDLE